MKMSHAHRTRFLVLAAALVGGCLEQAEPAELLLPEPVSVEWEVAYDVEGDGLGALVQVDLMAYDGATGQPLEAIGLTVAAESGAAWPVESEQVVVVDPEDCFGCELLWDAQRDEFLLAPQVNDVLSLTTDEDGLARLYLYVDAFPEGSGGREFDDLVVLVVMGENEERFLLLPR